MTRITVRTDGGKVKIRLGDEVKAPAGSVTVGVEPPKPLEPMVPTKKTLLLSSPIINLMEIRSESSFRPKEEDVELVYALSSSTVNVPDMLHNLSSRTVVEEATQDHITSSVRGMIKHVTKERDSEPKLVVGVHTHPQSISRPSEGDKRYFISASETIQALIPGANVLFGVHAVSSESIRERQEPAKISRNAIRWSSITREHEVAFYTPNAEPYEVKILEQ